MKHRVRRKISPELTEADKKQILELHESGIGICTIGMRLKLGTSRIRSFLIAVGANRDRVAAMKLRANQTANDPTAKARAKWNQ